MKKSQPGGRFKKVAHNRSTVLHRVHRGLQSYHHQELPVGLEPKSNKYEVAGLRDPRKEMSFEIPFCIKNGRFERKRWAPTSHFASKMADFLERYELRNRTFASKMTDLKTRDELRNPMFTSKTTDLKARDELRTPNSHVCV